MSCCQVLLQAQGAEAPGPFCAAPRPAESRTTVNGKPPARLPSVCAQIRAAQPRRPMGKLTGCFAELQELCTRWIDANADDLPAFSRVLRKKLSSSGISSTQAGTMLPRNSAADVLATQCLHGQGRAGGVSKVSGQTASAASGWSAAGRRFHHASRRPPVRRPRDTRVEEPRRQGTATDSSAAAVAPSPAMRGPRPCRRAAFEVLVSGRRPARRHGRRPSSARRWPRPARG